MKKPLLLVLTILCAFVSRAQEHKIQIQNCLKPFYHGVASGDPLPNAVIIWTRVTPDSANFNQSLTVNWKVATDTGMSNIIQSGTAVTDSSLDYTVKVDVTNLQPNTFYFYEFDLNNSASPRGRTKTTPIGNAVDSLRFALTSCANFEAGYFNTYNSLLQRQDFDAVIALGDYIYEYNTGGYSPNSAVGRSWSPLNEIVSISDYRMRYSSYKLDDDLQRLHQQFPFIIVYDDHEFANDAWMNGAENHQANEGPWSSRIAMAKKAFFEWLPIRQVSTTNPYQIYRTIKYGNLVDLIMMDTRVEGRELQSGTSGTTVTSTNRHLISPTQFNWLTHKLDSSSAQWKILGQQVMMAPLKVFGTAFNGDQWDGYPAERDRVLSHVLNNNISNVVVITGDIHSSWANDLPTSTYNSSTGAGSAGVEFVTPSVTSPGLNIPLGASAIKLSNGHIKFCDLTKHGFVIMDINKTRTQADWYFENTIDAKSSAFTYAASYSVSAGTRFLSQKTSAASPRNSVFMDLAPLCPRTLNITNIHNFNTKPIVLSAYPNPATNYLNTQVYLPISGDVSVSILNLEGATIQNTNYNEGSIGLYKYQINTTELPAGTYILSIRSNGYAEQIKFIKH